MFQSQTQNVLPIELSSDGIIGRHLILDHQTENVIRLVAIAHRTDQCHVVEVISSSERFRDDVLQVISNATNWLRCSTILTSAVRSKLYPFSALQLSLPLRHQRAVTSLLCFDSRSLFWSTNIFEL